MRLKTKLFGSVYQFASIKEVLAKANEEKSGDVLAGVAAADHLERVAAKEVLPIFWCLTSEIILWFLMKRTRLRESSKMM